MYNWQNNFCACVVHKSAVFKLAHCARIRLSTNYFVFIYTALGILIKSSVFELRGFPKIRSVSVCYILRRFILLSHSFFLPFDFITSKDSSFQLSSFCSNASSSSQSAPLFFRLHYFSLSFSCPFFVCIFLRKHIFIHPMHLLSLLPSISIICKVREIGLILIRNKLAWSEYSGKRNNEFRFRQIITQFLNNSKINSFFCFILLLLHSYFIWVFRIFVWSNELGTDFYDLN